MNTQITRCLKIQQKKIFFFCIEKSDKQTVIISKSFSSRTVNCWTNLRSHSLMTIVLKIKYISRSSLEKKKLTVVFHSCCHHHHHRHHREILVQDHFYDDYKNQWSKKNNQLVYSSNKSKNWLTDFRIEPLMWGKGSGSSRSSMME